MGKIRILVADDHAIVRVGLVALLGRIPDFEVVGEASSGSVALSKSMKLAPDVAILDLVMPKMDGVETTAALREKSPGTKVLILTSFGTSEDLSRALNAGATGAILKNAANCERTFPTESCIQSPPNGRLQARASRCAGARLASRSEDRRESRCGRNRLVPVP